MPWARGPLCVLFFVSVYSTKEKLRCNGVKVLVTFRIHSGATTEETEDALVARGFGLQGASSPPVPCLFLTLDMGSASLVSVGRRAAMLMGPRLPPLSFLLLFELKFLTALQC